MKTKNAILLLLGLTFALFFFRLGDRALWSSDEGRYAEIPREMVEQSNYISPHLNYVRYFEKPPLVYWLTAANYRLFGQSEGSARFWPAFLGALGVAMVCFFARRWFGGDSAFWSGWFLLASIGYFLVGRFLILDMPFTFFFSAGLLCFLEGFEENKKRMLAAAYVLLGLATLVKGIVACVFPVMIVIVYLTWTRQWFRWRQTGLLWGIPLLLAVVLPWFIWICAENPSFFEFFFVHEHLQRFVTHSAGRPGHFYYFFGIGMVFFFPWSLFTFFVGEGICSLKVLANPRDRKRVFLLIWVLVIFVFFTLSRSKLPPYILPILPPLALLLGHWVVGLFTRTDGRYRKIVPALFGFAFAAIVVGCVVLLLYLPSVDKPEKAWLGDLIYLVAALFVIGAGLAFYLSCRPRQWKWAFVTWGVTIFLAYPVVLRGMERLDPLQSAKELALVLAKEVRPQDTLAIYGGYEDFSDLPFYLHRRIIIVGTNVGELTYGSNLGDQSDWFVTVPQFANRVHEATGRGENVYCIAQENEYNELLGKGIRNFEVYLRTPKAYLLIKRARKDQ